MSFGAYARSRAWEYLLVLACTWSLSVVVMDGFWVDAALQRGPVPALVCVVLLFALYVAAWRGSSLVPGGIGVAVLCAVAVAGSIALSSGADPWADSPDNYLMGMLCVLLCTLAGFLLTRTMAGSAVWFVACVFACAFIEAAYRTGELALTLVVLVCALSLIVWRNCAIAQRNASTLRRVSRTANLGTAIIPVLGTVALACAVWFCIIAPLHPGELKLELITDYRTQQIVHVKGVGDIEPEVNTDLKSDDFVDGPRWTTDDLQVSDDADKKVEAKSVPEDQRSSAAGNMTGGGSSGSGSRDTINPNDPERRWDEVSYSIVFPLIIAIIVFAVLVIAALIAFFALRRKRRARRLEGWLAKGRRSQVMSIYLFLTEKLAKLGFKVPPGMTIAEWARGSERSMEGLREQTHVPFSELTATYAKVAYGGYVPTEEEVVPFVTWYLWFWKAARAHLGNFRYFFKSFRLG